VTFQRNLSFTGWKTAQKRTFGLCKIFRFRLASSAISKCGYAGGRVDTTPILTGLLLAAVAIGAATAMLLQRVATPRISPWVLRAGLVLADIAVTGWSATVMPTTPLLAATCALGWALVTLAVIDALVFRLPDYLTLPLVAAGLGVVHLLPDTGVTDHAIGAAAGFGVFALIAELYRRARGREGLGLGDAKLAAAAGAWLGWEALPGVVIVASVLGIVWVAVRYLLRGEPSLDERIAFGVPLCAAFWLAWLYGPVAPFAQ
jgi:leader peptidase (prepilin peptidase)/N-methyltransferase